jgi:hypothetical protein
MFIRLNQFHPDGRVTPLLCNVEHINNVQERINAPTGTPVMDPVTKQFPVAKAGSAVTFQNSHAFVTETVDEVYSMIRNAEFNGGSPAPAAMGG